MACTVLTLNVRTPVSRVKVSTFSPMIRVSALIRSPGMKCIGVFLPVASMVLLPMLCEIIGVTSGGLEIAGSVRFCEASFSPTNGLLQGDPSAPACLVAFLCEPIRRIQLLWPAVSISQYANDVLFLLCDAAQLRQAHDYFTHWLHGRNVELNAHKCFWASTAADPDLPDFWVGTVLLKRTDVLEWSFAVECCVGLCSFLCRLCRRLRSMEPGCWEVHGRCQAVGASQCGL